VPYVGASGNVDLNLMNLTTTGINITRFISGTANITSTALGAYAFGGITGTGSGMNSSIHSRGTGSFAHGSITAGATTNSIANITALNPGSIAIGQITLEGGSGHKASIFISNSGAFAGGFVDVGFFGASNNIGRIGSTSSGALSYGFVAGSASNLNASILATANGATALGFVQDANINATAPAALAHGYVQDVGSSVTSNSAGSFVNGVVRCGGGFCNSNISTFSNGINGGNFVIGQINGRNSTIYGGNIASVAIGYIDINSPNNFIVSRGLGSVAIGLPNMSVSGIGSIALGQNVNITGSNSIGIGLGSTTLKAITQNNIFVVNDGNFYLNGTTNPTIQLGQSQESSIGVNVSSDLIINPKTVGTGKTYNLGDFIADNLTASNNSIAQHFIGEGSQITNLTFTGATSNFTTIYLTYKEVNITSNATCAIISGALGGRAIIC